MVTRSEVRRLAIDVGEFLARHDSELDVSEFAAYRDDPLGFMRDVLRWEPWEAQEEIAESVLVNPMTAVRGANGTGKDAVTSRLALWWAVCRGGLAILTGPTQRQVRNILFGEIRRAWSRTDLPGELFEQELRLDRESGAGILGMTSSEVGALTGFHAENVLGVITEAQSVEPMVFEALLSCAVGESDRLLALMNPLHPSGEAWTISQPGSGWHSIQVSAFRHPNVVEDRTVIPGGVTRAFIDRMRSRYGEDSPIYRSRVLGEFPTESAFGLIDRAWLDAAATRYAEAEEAGWLGGPASTEPVVAVDPARYGPDLTAVAVVIGDVLVRLETWGKVDTMETTGRVIEELRRVGVRPAIKRGDEYARQLQVEDALAGRYGRSRLDPWGVVVVDVVGVGGGVADRLEELGYTVVPFNGGRSPRMRAEWEQPANLRAEAYWTLRRLLEASEIVIPRDEELFQELVSLQWKPNSAGRIQLESKDDLKARIGRSTDRGDAASMAFHEATRRNRRASADAYVTFRG